MIPARSAARVDPVQALQKGRIRCCRQAKAALAALLAARARRRLDRVPADDRSRLLLHRLRAGDRGRAAPQSAAVARWLARALRPLLKWIRPVEGALAADSLIQAPRRTSASVAALMLSLALVVAFAGMARASYDSIIDWMEMALNPDLFVMPSQSIVIRTIRFPADMGPGDRRGSRRRAGSGRSGRPRHVSQDAGDGRGRRYRKPCRRPRTANPWPATRRTMYRRDRGRRGTDRLRQPGAASAAALGEMLELPAPGGPIRLPIVGIVVDYSDQQGTILMDRTCSIAVLERRLDQYLSGVSRAGAQRPTVRQAILERFARQRQVFVLTNDELSATS